MLIKWFPPLDRIFGPQTEYEAARPLALRTVLIDLRETEPDFLPYANFGPEDRQPYGLMVWRSGQVLGLDDPVGPDDELEMIIMIAGG